MISSNAPGKLCCGLDGRDPQHFLAALGLHKIVSAIAENKGNALARTTLSWKQNGSHWNPEVSNLGSNVSFGEVVEFLHCFSKKEYEALNEAQADSRKLPQGVREPEHENKSDQFRFNEKLSDIFRFGDIIGVEAEKFREQLATAQTECFSESAFSRISADELSGLGTDIVCVKKSVEEDNGGEKKKIEKLFATPTFFSFSNGNSGKCLLKDARNCMAWVNSENLRATLEEGDSDNACIKKDFAKTSFPTPLNWSPESLANHALSRIDPAKAKQISFPAREALAFWGLSQFVCFPTSGGLNIPCIKKIKSVNYFCWPIWKSSLSVLEVFWLLSQFDPYSSRGMKLKGIDAEFQVMALNPNGKRYYFSASSLPAITD